MTAIKHEDSGSKGRFYIKEGEAYLAQMTYSRPGDDKIIIAHTEVDEQLKGQGIGKKMLDELVTWARAEHLKIIPLCPFAKSVMEKKLDEYIDVLYRA